MEWPRVKTILIILLLAVNVFLFCTYAKKSVEQSRNEEQVRSKCRIMNGMGYEINPSLLPADSQMCYPARITRDTDRERVAFGRLLGHTQAETGIGMSRYSGERGELSLRNGGYIEGVVRLGNETQIADRAEIVKTKFAAMNTEIVSPSVKDIDGVTMIEATCTAAGKPVFNCRVKCAVTEKEISMSGRIPPGEVFIIQNMKPRAISGLILNFAEHMRASGVNYGKVENIVPGYWMSTTTEFENGVSELVPVWKIRMDGKDYFVDALDGEMITAE